MPLEYTRGGSVCVYVDGSCLNNGRDGAVAGIGVFWAKNHRDNVSEPLNGRPTNQRAEIRAALTAIEIALDRGYDGLHIVTDSDYLYRGATDYIHNWRHNGWINARGNPVANRADWQDLLRAQEELGNVTYEHTYGHSNNYGNDMANALAQRGAQMMAY